MLTIHRFLDTLQLLLDVHANINVINKEGFTPLHFAACEGILARFSRIY